MLKINKIKQEYALEVVVSKDGTLYHIQDNGSIHQDNGGPAIICNNGEEFFWQNDKKHTVNQPRLTLKGRIEYYKDDDLHRLDGPAIIQADGTLEYWVHGERHREDGPARIYPNGRKEYYQNGKLHRGEDLPAIIKEDGSVEYYKHGKLHRENAPAIVNINGYKGHYYLDGKFQRIEII